MTIGDRYKIFVEELITVYDERESANITDWIFESIAGIKKLDRVTHKQKAIDNRTIEQLNAALQQLLAQKPVQYVVGEAWFYKMKLKVNTHVLIPRPETEELVEWVVEEIRNKPARMTTSDGKSVISNEEVSQINICAQPSYRTGRPTILDIGTGSGCIAIALKKELTTAKILAVDVSLDALQIAAENAAAQNTSTEFLQLDFLNETSWDLLSVFDIIVSNPPYIPENEKCKLANNVVAHEPHIALFVDNDDPFIFYKKIAAFARDHLKGNGKIFVELHEDYAEEVEKIFAGNNFATEKRKDIYGRDRMIKACR